MGFISLLIKNLLKGLVINYGEGGGGVKPIFHQNASPNTKQWNMIVLVNIHFGFALGMSIWFFFVFRGLGCQGDAVSVGI